ncbi:MAG: SGNH/GDSL hydrolase family protein, partial [Endomicrobiaceae bacterium]|nr:SGNH/GDSL hydrolase family protein [Endomicrobiaceae bacterium]
MKYEYLLKKILLIFLGFIFSFFLLEFVLQTASFITKIVISAQNKSLESQIANANFKKNKNTLTILCIGESTTYKQWPIQLQMYLNRNKSSVNYQVVDCGIPATNLDLILKNLDMQLKKYNPDIIISMMGINDIPRGNLTYIKHQLKTIELLELLKLHIMFKEPIFNHYDFDGFEI